LLIAYFISVFIHILSATVWLGGSVLAMILHQKEMQTPGYKSGEARQIIALWTVCRNITWLCFFLLIVTGLYNLFVRGYSWHDLIGSEFWNGYLGNTLRVKLFLFSGILLSSLVNNFYVKDLIEANGEARLDRLDMPQKKLLFLLGTNLILGFGVLFCAIMLVRGKPW